MDTKHLQRVAKKIMTGQKAGRDSDPAFYQGLAVLPNPDPILRAMGKADEAHAAIMADAHVIGELRAIRAGLLGYKTRVVAGAKATEDGKQQQALELCQQLMDGRPAPDMTWPDTIWNMATAIFQGFRVHELVWQKSDQWVLPLAVLDRPNRRFKFSNDNQLRLLTKDNQVDGEEIESYRFLLTRHMPSIVNPYGQALLSSCFWPYTFKHGGFKFFYQFCERYGMPWPIGKYPQGTQPKEQQELLDALVEMYQQGAAAVPDGDTVELLSVNHSGELVQESLIHLCNREMSKALTSQTLATEMHKVGSNAASKTHQNREQGVHSSDRNIIAASFNQMFADITRFNFGEDVVPPVLEFHKQKEVTKERADIWEIATRVGNPSRAAFHKEMNIPEAESDDDKMQRSTASTSPSVQKPEQQFSACSCGQPHYNFAQPAQSHLVDATIEHADAAIESQWITPALEMLKQYEDQGKTLKQYLDDLPKLYGQLDDDQLKQINSQMITLAFAQGMDQSE